MYRSASMNRPNWDENFSYHTASSVEADELPVYEPFSEAAKKEKSRVKFAENAVHIIPFVLLFCAFVLWFLSNPDVDVKDNFLAAKNEGITNEAHFDSDGTGHLSVNLGDLDPTKLGDAKNFISENRS
ncbi:hypothetical protein BUALT_Bualt01G0061200 [Buddleja alternifolia]|uniref:Transmembrane protein n=1 Tax=Buddleja alternifolia TaxID=168488 RepID=A0AAV6YFC6_9LAMI|nr:hypothetical protein BUALT_Bualt01G0061200 [Buddleja alternifolia]